jgi:hypothetical protein
MNKSQLKFSKIYGVETKTRIYIGTYICRRYTHDNDMYYTLIDVIEKFKPMNNPICSYFMCTSRKIKRYVEFGSNDIVYDLEEIKENCKKARQDMEQRALNKILKKIVNENFEW